MGMAAVDSLPTMMMVVRMCAQLEVNFEVGDYVIEVSGANGGAIESYVLGVLSEELR